MPGPFRERSNDQAAAELSCLTNPVSKRCFPKELYAVLVRTKLQIQVRMRGRHV